MKKTSVRVGLGLVGLILVLSTVHAFAAVPAIAKRSKAQSAKAEEIQGELEVIVEDQKESARTLYNLKSDGKTYRLNLAKAPTDNLQSGMTVRVRGVRNGDDLTAESMIAESSVSSFAQVGGSVGSTVLPNTTGEHKVLVILVNFQDKQTQPFTAEQARDVTFNTTSNYFREVSYGQTWLTGDVYGWYTIPVSSTVCDKSAIANYAQQAATRAGANLAAYSHLVYAFPQTIACPFSGSSTVGGSPSQEWINTDSISIEVLGHELGHGLGLYHSKSMDCRPSVVGTNCLTNEYGDKFDIMGASMPVHMSLFQKERLGWVDYGSSPPLTTITTSGTYWMDAYETPNSNVKGLKILKSIDAVTGSKTWYYLEHRTASGFDTYFSGYSYVLEGVVVHMGSEGSGEEGYLLDMTPSTTSWYDSTVLAGQTYNDPTAGISITTISADSSGAWVQVTVGSQTCTRAKPTVAMTPGQSQLLTAGSTFIYSVTVKNNDSAGCSSQNFVLTSVIPTNWIGSYAVASLSIAAGASATTSFSVTSPIDATEGTYTVIIGAGTGGKSEYASSASATYSIVSPFVVTVASGSKSYSRTQKATATATVRANGLALSGAAVSFTMTKPSGAIVTQNVTTGPTGSAVFTYTFNKRNDPLGTYQVKAVSSANGLTGQAVTSFLVNK
jgi:hypothetical protein